MKKLLLFAVLVLVVSACTDNQRARQWGGTETINLPKGEKLVTVTWKGVDLWYLTEQMDSSYRPEVKYFREDSNMGAFEGTVKFVESR